MAVLLRQLLKFACTGVILSACTGCYDDIDEPFVPWQWSWERYDSSSTTSSTTSDAAPHDQPAASDATTRPGPRPSHGDAAPGEEDGGSVSADASPGEEDDASVAADAAPGEEDDASVSADAAPGTFVTKASGD